MIKKKKIEYFTYLALCSDNSIYTGYTNSIIDREKTHNNGKGAAYTRTRRPIKIIYFESFSSRKEAMKRGREIKGWRREKKLELVKTEKNI